MFHSVVSVFLFTTLTVIDKSFYKLYSEIMAILIGYISANFLASAFLTYGWFYFAIGNMMTATFVCHQCHYNFKLEFFKLGPSLLMMTITCCIIAYFSEYKDKMEFLEMKQTEIL